MTVAKAATEEYRVSKTAKRSQKKPESGWLVVTCQWINMSQIRSSFLDIHNKPLKPPSGFRVKLALQSEDPIP